MGGLYSTDEKKINKSLDYSKLKTYGDSMNDGKIQVSFTLPVKSDRKATKAAKDLVKKMNIENPEIVYQSELTPGFTFFIIYGNLKLTVDFTSLVVDEPKVKSLTKDEINSEIENNFNRKLVVLGASTGTDAHTVGIDAILNKKGFAGHYGLETYDTMECHNLGSQVPNEIFVKKAIELKADIILVSQTVTQKNVHISNLTNLVDLLEAEGIRDKVILICGGARISHELAKELGFDAGFGPETYAEDVASFFVEELKTRSVNS